MAAPIRLPRALLVSLREPTDPMAAHERACFADRAALPLENVDVHSMVDGRPDRGHLRSFDAIFFGGSGAFSVLDEVQWIQDGLATLLDVAELRVPAWASCFGFQGLSKALGGEVNRDDARQELGAVVLRLTAAGQADPIIGVLPEEFWAQEGHHDHVDVLPRGVTLLAQGSAIHNQAFRVDGTPFYASQFHPELTVRTTIDRFTHYARHYAAADNYDAQLAMMLAGSDTPQMGEVLPRLVRLGRTTDSG